MPLLLCDRIFTDIKMIKSNFVDRLFILESLIEEIPHHKSAARYGNELDTGDRLSNALFRVIRLFSVA